ncbi:MAG TPA: GNAT family N-acetyltransferase, partial [Xanthobacteraceae bacterium]|nr:GNAT family N-acetyltransferase [Xanthobacteraceae bacterium]
FHRKGLGSTLLADAALRVIKGDVKAFALIVDAKDENAVAFYQHHGFQAFASRSHSLFLPLGTVKKGAASSRGRHMTKPQTMTNQLAPLPSRSLAVPALVAGGDEVNLDEVERISI